MKPLGHAGYTCGYAALWSVGTLQVYAIKRTTPGIVSVWRASGEMPLPVPAIARWLRGLVSEPLVMAASTRGAVTMEVRQNVGHGSRVDRSNRVTCGTARHDAGVPRNQKESQ